MPLQGFARADLPEQLEALIDALHLIFGLNEMLLEQLTELIEASCLGHLRKRLG